MKNNFLIFLLSAACILTVSCSRTPKSPTSTGPDGGGKNPGESQAIPGGPRPQGTDFGSGGDAYAAEFKDIGRTIVRRLKIKNINEVTGISTIAFENTLEKAEIKTTEAVLTKEGAQIDALNFPSQMKIELNLIHWANSMDFSQKRRLVIHEILGLMRKEDSDYGATSQVLKALGFLHDVLVDKFRIQGEVAKTIMEKMHWNEDEVEVEEYLPHGRRTWYETPFRKVVCPLKCWKQEFLLIKKDTWYECDITGTAYYTDQGTIHMELGTSFEPLVRLFGRTSDDFTQSQNWWEGVKMTHFDYGVIKGHISGLAHLEIFP